MTMGRDESLVAARTWDELYAKCRALRWWPAEELVRFIARHFGHVPHAQRRALSVLEVGCGNGGNLWFLAAEGFRTYGLDLSAIALELAAAHCRARGVHTVQLVTADILHSGFSPRTFDAVVDVTCLQHLTEPEHAVALSAIRRLLVPRGLLFSYRLARGTHGYDQIFAGNPPVWLLAAGQVAQAYAGYDVLRVGRVAQSRPRGTLHYFSIDARARG